MKKKMQKRKKKEDLLKKISSKYVHNQIYSFIPYNSFLNLIKYNKYLQKISHVSIYNFQKSFLENYISINFNEISSNEFITFLHKEFNNFSKANDEKTLQKIIKEIKSNNTFIKEKKATKYKNHQIIKLTQNINWKNYNNNIKELNISSEDSKSLINIKHYPKLKQIKIPSGIFPNLNCLCSDSNCIIPASLLINLIKLYIFIIPDNDILFINDVKKDIVDLENLKYINIERFYKDECFDFDKERKKTKEKNKEKVYRIKFNLKNIEKFLIQIRIEEDFSFISDYFCLDDIYYTLNKNEIKNDINKIHMGLKESMLNHKYSESLQYFRFNVVTKRETEDDTQFLVQSFKMKKSINNIKHYTFKLVGHNEYFYVMFHKEKYDNDKIKFFKNYGELNCLDVSIDKLNVLRLRYNDEIKDKKFYQKKINEIFDIKDDNYSVQEILVNFKSKEGFLDNLIKNISKFKVLQKLIIIDDIKDKKLYFKLIEDISKLVLLKSLSISCKEKLDKKQIKSIKKLLPKSLVEEASVIQNTDIDYDFIDEISENDSSEGDKS